MNQEWNNQSSYVLIILDGFVSNYEKTTRHTTCHMWQMAFKICVFLYACYVNFQYWKILKNRKLCLWFRTFPTWQGIHIHNYHSRLQWKTTVYYLQYPAWLCARSAGTWRRTRRGTSSTWGRPGTFMPSGTWLTGRDGFACRVFLSIRASLNWIFQWT